MKIKAYFITYKNNAELNKTLDSFAKSGILKHDFEAIVVNNSVDTPVVNNSEVPIRVVENNTRPSFSTGHLSRNWNECLMDGFKDVNNPDCDIVILSQNDNRFLPDTIDNLIESHKAYSFIQSGGGDTFHSYTIDAIKKVGLWDERFCGIGYQEADYLLRQFLFNPQHSIKDEMHSRVSNPLGFDILGVNHNGFTRGCEHHLKSMKNHEFSRRVFEAKWGGVQPNVWDEMTRSRAILNNKQFVLYPYFEKHLDSLNYFYNGNH